MIHAQSLNVFLCAVALALASCAAPLDFSGPYSNQLSQNDVEEIKLLVSKRSDIRKPVFRIWVDRPNSALVQTGRALYVGDIVNEFRVAKKDGTWRIASKITEDRIIVKAP
jgi:hypothetical protein